MALPDGADEPGGTSTVRKPSALRCAGAKSTIARRSGSIATTVTSHAPFAASSIIRFTAPYSISFAGTPARAASSRPSAGVVRWMIGLDVSTATRSSPVGASCAFTCGEGPLLAQPMSVAAPRMVMVLFICNSPRPNGAILAQ